jgi:serine/threonine protein kinase
MIGTELGRYLVVDALGEGGMAAVYKGFDRRLNRDVAIKVILRGYAGREVFLKRFEREAKAVAQLTHPNIVRVIDYGTQDEVPYLVMEFIPGGTLREQMGTSIPWKSAAQMLAPVARALDYAHQENIIHRDIKPANILITKSGDLMLSDFGIAKTLGLEDSTNLTGTGVGIGTPAYMAPEQGLGVGVDHRVDVYSLGVVFFEMLAGRPPYQADTPMAVMLKHINDPLPRPRQFAPAIPTQVEEVLFKALAKDPEHRFQSMADFAQALEDLTRVGVTQPPEVHDEIIQTLVAAPSQPQPDSIQSQPLPEADAPEWAPTVSDSQESLVIKKGSRKPIWIAGVLGVLLITILAIYAGGRIFRSMAGINQAATAPTETSTPTLAEVVVLVPTSTPFPPTLTIASISSTPTTVPSPTPPPLLIVDNYGITMVLILAGEFTMGASEADALDACHVWNPRDTCSAFYFKDEAPIRTVGLADYYIDQYEVTNNAYKACVEAGVCAPPFEDGSHSRDNYYSDTQYSDYPVVFTGWDGASIYCEWRGGRLPTEAEWEKAARGTDGRSYPWGDTLDASRANFCDANCDRSWANSAYDDGFFDTAPVGSYPEGASPYGAHDMAGNVSEWVEDIYAPYPGGEADINSDHYGSTHVRRGGSWYSLGSDLRTTRRDKDLPFIMYDGTDAYLANNRIGFRCVVDVTP